MTLKIDSNIIEAIREKFPKGQYSKFIIQMIAEWNAYALAHAPKEKKKQRKLKTIHISTTPVIRESIQKTLNDHGLASHELLKRAWEFNQSRDKEVKNE
jgi:hypothetical protein